MPRITKLQKIARQLHKYMEFRAKEEGTGYDLNEAFFIGGIKAGIPNFFGISFDTSRLTGDFQNPDAFAKWQVRQNKDNEPND